MSNETKGGQKDLKSLPRMDAIWESAICANITMMKNVITRSYSSDIARKWAICMIGESGIGKNQLQEQVTSDLGIDYLWFSCKGLAPEDLRGFPMPVRKLNGETYAGDMNGLVNLMHDYYHKEPVYRFQTLEYLEKAFNPGFKGIIHFDELAQASKEVQEVLYSLFYDRRIDDRKLSDGALIVISMNPPQVSDYMIAKLSKALVDRLALYKVVSTADEWLRWAKDNNVHPSLYSFVVSSPQTYERNKGRRLKHLSDMLYTFTDLTNENAREELRVIVNSCIDVDSAASFAKHLREIYEVSGVGILAGDKAQFKRLKSMLEKNSKAVQMHKIQSDMGMVFESPTTYLSDLFGAKGEDIAYRTIADNLVKYMILLGDNQMMDSNVSLLKTLIESSSKSKNTKIEGAINRLLMDKHKDFYTELMKCMNLNIKSSSKNTKTMAAGA